MAAHRTVRLVIEVLIDKVGLNESIKVKKLEKFEKDKKKF